MKPREIKKQQNLTDSKVVMLRLFNPDGEDDFYFFGSLSAIYEMFTAKQLGVALSTLYLKGVREDHPYIGLKCSVYKSTLWRKKQK